MADFKLQIVTQQTTVFDEATTSVVVPAEGGYLGILANHAPIVAVLKAGSLTIRQGTKTRSAEVGAGFLEMSNNVATLLVDSFEED